MPLRVQPKRLVIEYSGNFVVATQCIFEMRGHQTLPTNEVGWLAHDGDSLRFYVPKNPTKSHLL